MLPEAYGAGTLQDVVAINSNNFWGTKAFYNIAFNTGTTGTIKTVTMTFPPGFNVVQTKLVETQNIGAGTISVAGQTVTYTVASALSIPAATNIRIVIGEVGNGAIAPATPNQVAVTTKDGSAVILDGPTNSANFFVTPVQNFMIANSAITSSKIMDGNVQTVDLADGAVTLAKLAANSVDSSKIVNGT